MIARVELHLSPEAELNGNSFVFLRLEYRKNSCLFSRGWRGLVPLSLRLDAWLLCGHLSLWPAARGEGPAAATPRRSLLGERSAGCLGAGPVPTSAPETVQPRQDVCAGVGKQGFPLHRKKKRRCDRDLQSIFAASRARGKEIAVVQGAETRRRQLSTAKPWRAGSFLWEGSVWAGQLLGGACWFWGGKGRRLSWDMPVP